MLLHLPFEAWQLFWSHLNMQDLAFKLPAEPSWDVQLWLAKASCNDRKWTSGNNLACSICFIQGGREVHVS